jgi:hypothetical protein
MAFQPINSDGSLDTSRTQKYQRFDIFFKLWYLS